MDVVILQPFYLPYAGVFELVRMADVFVFYDDVQLTRRNWMVRNQIKTASGPQWLSVPVLGPRDSTIREARLNESEQWRRKHKTAIENAYARAPHVATVLDALGPYWDQEWPDLATLNIATFTRLCELMKVGSEFIRSSDMGVPGVSSQRILDVCRSRSRPVHLRPVGPQLSRRGGVRGGRDRPLLPPIRSPDLPSAPR